MPLSIVFTF